MKRPAQSYKAIFAAGFFLLAVTGIVGPAYGSPKPNFVYIVNVGNSTDGHPNHAVSSISGYSIDATTGALSPVPGSPFSAGMTADAIATDPLNRFVFVLNEYAGTVSAFTIDSTTGALTAVSGSPATTGAFPISIAVDPSGKFVYVVNTDTNGSVSAYTIDAASGALTPIPGSPFAAGVFPQSVSIAPSGKFVYVVENRGEGGDGDIAGYDVDANTGALAPMAGSPFPAGIGPGAAVVDPHGKFFYSINIGVSPNLPGNISAYTINSGTGALTPIAGSPFATGITPTSVVVDPSDKFAFVTGGDTHALLTYTIDGSSGALQLIGNLGFTPAAANPYSVAVDPSGKFVYVTTLCSPSICPGAVGAVSAYSLNTTSGALTLVPGSPFAAGTQPIALVTTQESTVPFKRFDVHAWIDEDIRTAFLIEGSFRLGDGSDGVDPTTQDVDLQLGLLSVTVPAGSFKKRGWHEYEFDGKINGVNLDFVISHDRVGDYSFTVEGRAMISTWFHNPVTVGLTIGDNQGSTEVRADIDR